VLSYTSFVSDVTANKVSTAAITSAGSVSGKLRDGSAYNSQIPVALNDSGLPALLLGHKVQVTGTSRARARCLDCSAGSCHFSSLSGSSSGSVAANSKQLTGRIGGIMAFGKSKARVYDEDRPSTRFADIAGYEGQG